MQKAEEAESSSSAASNSAIVAESYAHGDTGAREYEAVDNAKYYYEQAKQISQGINGVIPMGTVAFANIPTSGLKYGYMYNISDEFISDERFADGAGLYYGPGNNIIWVAGDKWDVTAASSVTGVKGAKEDTYRQGNVNITSENIGALAEDGDSAENTATFTSGDAASATAWTDVSVLQSGEKHKSVFNKISTMFKNIRYLYKMLGTSDISTIGNGTVTGAVTTINDGLSNYETLANVKSKGSATQGIYFDSNGVAQPMSYTVAKSVPSNAVFTDTNTWRGIQNNLTSTSTTDSLSAYQGKLLANGSARDSTKVAKSGDTMTGVLSVEGIKDTGAWFDLMRNGVIRASFFANYDGAGATIRTNGGLGLYLTNHYIDMDGIAKISYTSGNIDLCTNGSVRAMNLSDNAFRTFEALGFTNKSSRRVKENIHDITESEAKKLLDVNVVSFDYIEAIGGQKGQYGVIAEDVINILPSVVSIPNGYDENDDSDIDNILGVDYSKFVPFLIKMVQMQQKEVDALKAEIQK